MADDISEVKIRLGRIDERLTHMPTKEDMSNKVLGLYIAGGLAVAGLTGVMAKGFGWL